jgi:hypothetical protein
MDYFKIHHQDDSMKSTYFANSVTNLHSVDRPSLIQAYRGLLQNLLLLRAWRFWFYAVRTVNQLPRYKETAEVGNAMEWPNNDRPLKFTHY